MYMVKTFSTPSGWEWNKGLSLLTELIGAISPIFAFIYMPVRHIASENLLGLALGTIGLIIFSIIGIVSCIVVILKVPTGLAASMKNERDAYTQLLVIRNFTRDFGITFTCMLLLAETRVDSLATMLSAIVGIELIFVFVRTLLVIISFFWNSRGSGLFGFWTVFFFGMLTTIVPFTVIYVLVPSTHWIVTGGGLLYWSSISLIGAIGLYALTKISIVDRNRIAEFWITPTYI